jgi:subtilase family serine protease
MFGRRVTLMHECIDSKGTRINLPHPSLEPNLPENPRTQFAFESHKELVMNRGIFRSVVSAPVRRAGRIPLAIAAIVFGVSVSAQAQYVSTHHVREAVRTGAAQQVGHLPAAQVMSLNIVLPVRDEAALQLFIEDLYNPNSSSYRHFLTVPEFTERFGPSEADYDAVVRYAETHGLTVTGGSRDGMEVQVKGPVSAVETAFHVNMMTYRHPTESRVFYAPDREPTTTLSFPLWHISGLDNFSIPHPLYVKKSDYALAHGIDARDVVSHATTGSGPSASFLGSDMRAAYYGGTALTGAGQNLGLFEYLGTDLADLTTYFKNAKQTNSVPITLLSTDGTSTSCVYSPAGGYCDDTEQTLDMTQAIGMAPGLASLVMYVGSTDTAIISAMTTHNPLPTTIGCSWGWTPADPSTLNPYFEKMAAQGQTFFAASGDDSTWSRRNEAWPADNAYVVSVGGTDLTTTKAAGAWASETAWSDSGGGISPDKIAIPSWQKISGVINSSNKGSTTYRNGPDVAANANFTFYVCADQTTCTANEYGGTSFATPMWAGFIALVNQQLKANGDSYVGFLDPTIYPQNVTSTYGTDFHDITSGKSGSYSAVTGYDLVTGWGSPKPGLITTLAP